MRADGLTYQQIAETVGVGTVHRAASDFPIGKSEIINERGQTRPATYAKRASVEDGPGLSTHRWPYESNGNDNQCNE